MRHKDLSPLDLFGSLPVLRIKFCVCFPDDAVLPPLLGSAWRGLIGWELQRLICPFDRRSKCSRCTINQHCPYFLLLEKKSSLPGLFNAPRGYIFYSPEGGGNAEIHEIYVTLFGSCAKLFPALAKALFNGQKSGLGAGRFPYQILSFEKISPDGKNVPLKYDREGHISLDAPTPLEKWLGKDKTAVLNISLTTPLRLRKNGKYLDDFELPFFLASLARRLEALSCLFHNGKPLGKETWTRLEECFSDHGRIQTELRWRDLKRYSNRQRRHVPMGGMVGNITLEDSRFFRWFKAASLVHVGKGTAMGLGKVDILQ